MGFGTGQWDGRDRIIGRGDMRALNGGQRRDRGGRYNVCCDSRNGTVTSAPQRTIWSRDVGCLVWICGRETTVDFEGRLNGWRREGDTVMLRRVYIIDKTT